MPSTQNSSTADSQQTGSSVDSSTVDSNTVDSSTVDSSTVDSSTVDSSTVDSSTVDSSTVDSSTTDSSTTDPVPDPEPEPEPDEPYYPSEPDGPIDIAVNGVSDYVIVYDDSELLIQSFTEELIALLKKTYKVELSAVKASEAQEYEHCIYVGNLKEAYPLKSKLNRENDFGMWVSGNDYVLYATHIRLYDYLFEMLLKTELSTINDGNWSTSPERNFIYHESEYSTVSYIDYALQKNKKIGDDFLLDIFAPLSFVASDGTELVYRIYLPYDYDSSKKYPLLTFMHGAGQNGVENRENVLYMFGEMFSCPENPIWDSIVIAPQCKRGEKWVDVEWDDGGYRVDEVPESNEIKAVIELIKFVESKFSTDTNRYYVTGLSMGGFATWDLIMRHTEMFAGAVPICGAGDYKQAYKLIDMPIYTLHDRNDYTVPMLGTKEMVVALETLGSKVIFYEELTGYGHNVWSYAASKLEIWQWLYAQSKQPVTE